MELIIVGYTDNNFNWTNLTITEVLTETINIVEMIYRLLIIIGNKDITIENTLCFPYYNYFL